MKYRVLLLALCMCLPGFVLAESNSFVSVQEGVAAHVSGEASTGTIEPLEIILATYQRSINDRYRLVIQHIQNLLPSLPTEARPALQQSLQDLAQTIESELDPEALSTLDTAAPLLEERRRRLLTQTMKLRLLISQL